MDASAQLTRRTIVGSFIFRSLSARSSSPPRVALFQRSAEVRTYQCVENPRSSPLAPI